MIPINREKITPRMIHHFALAAALFWTLLVGFAVVIQYRASRESARENATVSARSQFFKDLVYRRWNADLGGVYAELKEGLEPNPYLARVEEREIVSQSGRTFTLINPAFMTRQVHELARETEGIQGHITSLDPIRPENRPDPWETRALKRFDSSEDEFAQVMEMEGKPYLRFMKPLITEQSCLSCHAFQGYKVGEVRGGISVAVPMEDFLVLENGKFASLVGGIAIIWFAGLLGIAFGGRSISLRAEKQLAAEDRVEALLKDRELMFREVQHRIKNNMGSMAAILNLKALDLQEPEGRVAMEDMARRFETMMSLYNRLYGSPDVSSHSLSDYLGDVAIQIKESAGLDRIALRMDLNDIDLSPDTLSALGIITLEAVTNALKYAFPEGQAGAISVSSRLVEDGGEKRLNLQIRDNGVGLSGEGGASSGGLGRTLMQSLAAQLGGTLTLNHEEGTTVEIDVPIVPG